MTRMLLLSHAEDAWGAHLANWLEQRSKESFSGHETWFVTNSYVQGNWIRRMALSHRKTLFGIQFFDRLTLRQHLCRLFCLPSPSFVTLQILLDAVAGQNLIEYTAARSLLDALDDLGASGWLDHYGLYAAFSTLRIPERLHPALRQLTSSVLWSPRVDSILLQRMTPQKGLSLGLFGLDAESFKDLNLLLAAAKRATQSDLWIAQPLGKEGLVFEWITTLEQKLNAGTVVCPTGCVPRPYETFLAHWQGGGERNVKPPEILVANG